MYTNDRQRGTASNAGRPLRYPGSNFLGCHPEHCCDGYFHTANWLACREVGPAADINLVRGRIYDFNLYVRHLHHARTSTSLPDWPRCIRSTFGAYRAGRYFKYIPRTRQTSDGNECLGYVSRYRPGASASVGWLYGRGI